MREETVEGGRWEDAMMIERNSKLKRKLQLRKNKKYEAKRIEGTTLKIYKKNTTRQKEDERMNLEFKKGRK